MTSSPAEQTITSSTRASIARVSVSRAGEEIARGTGFSITPELVLTAFHVVANRQVEGVESYGEIALTFPGCEPRQATIDPDLHDRAEDWAVLRCTAPEDVQPLVPAPKVSRGVEWQSYGFPDANPRDGMAFGGTVEDHRAQLDGVDVLQLFSRQAAAGGGAPVRGLSGAPVLVGGMVIGHMRFALMSEGKTVAGTLYACPISSVAERLPELLRTETPLHVPGFDVRRKLGEGGMGEVWLAEQYEPVRRKVALKVIKWGLDSKEVIGRFESERQALAMMSHEGIAKMLDAGATDRGRPYFVMEYVPGIPITEYCDQNKLDTHERLELFEQLCKAIHHAHQRGIIHRDIKPSNVLVEVVEGKPRCRVIDFGIAKATHQRLTEKTVFTQLGLMLGTPSYMSPEQADLDNLDIDTTSDVYSLGVLLYELLTGLLPFDAQRLQSAGYSEMQRILREEQPPHPSTKVSTTQADTETLAAHRDLDAGALARLLRGDLDWITLKALEKDRTRRYSSAAELGADIRRHLEHRPVLASPPSRVYRAGRFVQRHKLGVIAAVVMVVALLTGASLALWQAARARAAEAEALDEAETSQRITEFLVDLFEVSDPSEALGNTITARELLDEGAARIREELGDQPIVRAGLMGTMGMVYERLGLYDEAVGLLEEASQVLEEQLGPDHPETISALGDLGVAYRSQGRYDAAEPILERALETARRVFGDEHPDTLVAMNDLANLYSDRGDFAAAEPLYLQALEREINLYGEHNPDTLNSVSDLAALYQEQGRYAEAESLRRENVDDYRRVLGDDHPDTLDAMAWLAALYAQLERYDEAETLMEQNLEGNRRVLGNDHPDTLVSMHFLASLYEDRGRNEEAEELYLEALETETRTLGDHHRDVLSTQNHLATLYANLGRTAESEALLRRSLQELSDSRSTDHHELSRTYYGMACLEAHRGNRSEALDNLRQALERGWSDARISDDPCFASLRGDDEFERAVARVAASAD